MISKIRWSFMLSGYGQSALACFDLYKEKLFKSHQFVALVTDGQDTPVEDTCRNLGMKVFSDSARKFDTIEAYQLQLIDRFNSLEIDYIFC